MNKRNGTCGPLSPIMTKRVLLLVDWENLFFSLFSLFGTGDMRLDYRISELMRWVKTEVGELLGGSGFVFAPEHLSWDHQQICVNHGLRIMICPKRKLLEPVLNQKSGKWETEQDTVDETLIWFANTMITHPSFKFFCLVSGDSDFLVSQDCRNPSLFESMRIGGIKRALVVPTSDCFSKSANLLDVVDKHPKTLKRMMLKLDNLK